MFFFKIAFTSLALLSFVVTPFASPLPVPASAELASRANNVNVGGGGHLAIDLDGLLAKLYTVTPTSSKQPSKLTSLKTIN